MPLTRAQVRHVAQLARIGLEAGDEEFYAEQLSGILEHIDRLQEAPTADTPPARQGVRCAFILSRLRRLCARTARVSKKWTCWSRRTCVSRASCGGSKPTR